MNRASLPRWNEVTALFGGRFDPPHIGHREAVRGLFREPAVKQVIVLPSATPPHKPACATAGERFEMARLAFQSYGHNSFPHEVSIGDYEIKRSAQKPHVPSYTFDTLQELRSVFHSIAFVIGTDQLLGLPTWHKFPKILSQSHWIILERKPYGKDAIRKALAEWEIGGIIQSVGSDHWQVKDSSSSKPSFITVVPTQAPAYSSTQIRESITLHGIPPEDSLLPEVFGYLKVRRLYGSK